MKINYHQLLKKNMINVLKDVLFLIKKNDLQYDHPLYITFKTKNNNVILPKWLKKKYPNEMTIVIQHEYWGLKIFEEKFEIILSFNDIKVNLSIPFKLIISFADPYENFGLKIDNEDDNKLIKRNKRSKESKSVNKKNNVIDFKKFKKLN